MAGPSGPTGEVAPDSPLAPLTVVAAGSVDDGKSTLIGRLLYDENLLTEDQRETLEATDVNLAHVTDGLRAEREQGITIDIAWRYITLGGRRITIADTPGHEQYTRNMVTGASYADLAILLVDAANGVTEQTRRHLTVAGVLRVPGLLVVVNKMDAVGYRREPFERISAELEAITPGYPFARVWAVPVSALKGENVVARGIDWYTGPTVSTVLRSFVPPRPHVAAARLPVQMALYNGRDRMYGGTLTDGQLAVGSQVRVLPGGVRTSITQLLVRGVAAERAYAPAAVALALRDEVDVPRGAVIAEVESPPRTAHRLELVVMVLADRAEVIAGARYDALCATQRVAARIEAVHHRVSMRDGQREPVARLGVNDIGVVTVVLDDAIVVERHEEERLLGQLVLVDRTTGDTIAAAVVQAVAEDGGLSHEWSDVAPDERAARYGHRGRIVWLTGLPASGKSTLARALERVLFERGAAVVVLDGDNLRRGLSSDLGFTPADRHTNVQRVGHVAQLLHESGLIVICALVSPYRADRAYVRDLVGSDDFVEVYLDASIDLVTARDPKGLYARARRGEVTGVTGVDAPFEVPEAPDYRLDCSEWSLDDTAAIAGMIVRRTALLESM